MYKILWYFLCALILLFGKSRYGNFSCNQPIPSQYLTTLDTLNTIKKEDHYTKINFPEAALRGADEVEITNSYEAITKDTALDGIFFHSTQYKTEIRKFLAAPNYTTDQKLIAICLIQYMPLNDYLEMCKYCASLFRKNQIDEEVLMWVIAPNFGEIQIVARNYKDPAVIATLKDIRGISNLSQTTVRVIDQILTGDETKFLK